MIYKEFYQVFSVCDLDNFQGMGRSVETQWLPVTVPIKNRVPTSNAASQTVGLYYPFSKQGSQKVGQDGDHKNESEFYERKPVLTAVSPGRGKSWNANANLKWLRYI